MEDIIYEAPPQNHPLEKYFTTYNDLNSYLLTFANRKEIPPRYLNIDVSGEEVKRMVPTSLINIRTLHHMGRNLGTQEDEEQQQEPPPPQEQAPQEQAGPSEPPSDQPSLRDIMQAIKNMELNMNQRMDKIEKNQARMLRKIRRVEAYTFDEDEAEDDDDDFWS
ncbi:hypothetical protein PIB30_107420 [Stylosanthes scabra]|uniref:Uncharacterized protein n=1 Tax=Stylosanthes scabra TaxID=79078 RepID=A0ABU6U150_9FABA|nr:hypothetical protein [Stylosanthes scabra]